MHRKIALNKGFTLMEIILVIGLLAMIFGITAFISLDSYRGSSFRNERDAFIGVLQRARSQAINNVCLGGCTDSKSHGVHITSTDFTIFQGSTYDSGDSLNEVTKVVGLIQIAPGSFTDVVFSQFSGDATTISTPSGIWTLTLTDTAGHSSQITIGSFGQITWTN